MRTAPQHLAGVSIDHHDFTEGRPRTGPNTQQGVHQLMACHRIVLPQIQANVSLRRQLKICPYRRQGSLVLLPLAPWLHQRIEVFLGTLSLEQASGESDMISMQRNQRPRRIYGDSAPIGSAGDAGQPNGPLLGNWRVNLSNLSVGLDAVAQTQGRGPGLVCPRNAKGFGRKGLGRCKLCCQRAVARHGPLLHRMQWNPGFPMQDEDKAHLRALNKCGNHRTPDCYLRKRRD